MKGTSQKTSPASVQNTIPIQSYERCVALMDGILHPRAGRPLFGGNTQLVEGWDGRDIAYVIRYRNTDVVTYHRDQTVTLNVGDGHNRGTERCFTFFSPFIVSKENGKWCVWLGTKWVPFRNGMRVLPPDAQEEQDEPLRNQVPRSRRERHMRRSRSSARIRQETVARVF